MESLLADLRRVGRRVGVKGALPLLVLFPTRHHTAFRSAVHAGTIDAVLCRMLHVRFVVERGKIPAGMVWWAAVWLVVTSC